MRSASQAKSALPRGYRSRRLAESAKSDWRALWNREAAPVHVQGPQVRLPVPARRDDTQVGIGPWGTVFWWVYFIFIKFMGVISGHKSGIFSWAGFYTPFQGRSEPLPRSDEIKRNQQLVSWRRSFSLLVFYLGPNQLCEVSPWRNDTSWCRGTLQRIFKCYAFRVLLGLRHSVAWHCDVILDRKA